jgi:transposase
LKPHLRVTIETLLQKGTSQREIERRTGVDRKTIRRYARRAKSPTPATGPPPPEEQTPPPRPPAPSPDAPAAAAAAAPSPTPLTPACLSRTPPSEPSEVSACEVHRPWIEKQVQLGRNAVSIYQDLVEQHHFTHRYNSVKRFVAKLRARDPERFDVLEFPPGEEAQVDFGQGAPTLYHTGRYRRPWLFVMTLKYSGKSFRSTTWKADQETWARLHEQAFHAFGGVVRYVVLDNLKQGVLHPDIYEPQLNPVYAALLAHYGAVADPCRLEDPNRKGTVENAIQHTQATALKGRRFDALEAQNEWLHHWEERWAAPRLHGRKKRQVLEMYREERPHLQPLPATRFRFFQQGRRTVDDSGLVQVDGSYYAALPAPVHSPVVVRLYDHDLEILTLDGQLLRRHPRAQRQGTFTLDPEDRVFNPSRETARLLAKAQRIGPQTGAFAQHLFARLGRPGQRALYGLTHLARTYPCAQIEAVCARLLAGQCYSYSALKRALERSQTLDAASPPSPTPAGPGVRDPHEYQAFWDSHTHSQEDNRDAHVDPRT